MLAEQLKLNGFWVGADTSESAITLTRRGVLFKVMKVVVTRDVSKVSYVEEEGDVEVRRSARMGAIFLTMAGRRCVVCLVQGGRQRPAAASTLISWRSDRWSCCNNSMAFCMLPTLAVRAALC